MHVVNLGRYSEQNKQKNPDAIPGDEMHRVNAPPLPDTVPEATLKEISDPGPGPWERSLIVPSN